MVFAQRVIDLDKLWGDMRVLGKYTEVYFGDAVAYGDINGDGFMDLIIGAPNADPGDPPRSYAGETYVIFGFSPYSPVTIDLSTTPADITVCGAAAEDFCGWAVANFLQDIEKSLSYFHLPLKQTHHRSKLKTVNKLESFFRGLRRKIHNIGTFENIESSERHLFTLIIINKTKKDTPYMLFTQNS